MWPRAWATVHVHSRTWVIITPLVIGGGWWLCIYLILLICLPPEIASGALSGSPGRRLRTQKDPPVLPCGIGGHPVFHSARPCPPGCGGLAGLWLHRKCVFPRAPMLATWQSYVPQVHFCRSLNWSLLLCPVSLRVPLKCKSGVHSLVKTLEWIPPPLDLEIQGPQGS